MRPDPLTRDQAVELQQSLCDLAGVHGLYGGQFGEVAMLFPGQRVRGLHVVNPSDDKAPQRLEVFVIAETDSIESLPNLDDLAQRVRSTVAEYTDVPVDVTVADIVTTS